MRAGDGGYGGKEKQEKDQHLHPGAVLRKSCLLQCSYRLESGSFLLRHYKITQRWAKVFLKALVERNSVMVEVFYMILISQKYDQKPTILKG